VGVLTTRLITPQTNLQKKYSCDTGTGVFNGGGVLTTGLFTNMYALDAVAIATFLVAMSL
jgi:hypothetical protein